jgi:putative ABC transport system ATP-binding protein
MSPETRASIVSVSALSKQVATGDVQLTILSDISFEVRDGEAVAIVGASGSGKSTLLGLLAGLDTPTGGRVMLDGHDLFALDEDGRARLRAEMVGFVFQSFQLLGGLTALENVMLPLELAGRSDAGEAARAMLARVGLAARLGHYPRHLSGGEQQRVALARAFVVRPKLLLADEPTGSLDAESGAGVIDLMLGLNHDFGTTLLLVTHDEQLAVRCQRAIRLAAGRIQP